MAAILRASVRRAISGFIHALGQQSRVEIVERSPATAGPGGRALEDLFHLMVVVLIETTDLLRFLGTLHLSANISVLRTVVGLNDCRIVGNVVHGL